MLSPSSEYGVRLSFYEDLRNRAARVGRYIENSLR
jgi:hypothetical protein